MLQQLLCGQMWDMLLYGIPLPEVHSAHTGQHMSHPEQICSIKGNQFTVKHASSFVWDFFSLDRSFLWDHTSHRTFLPGPGLESGELGPHVGEDRLPLDRHPPVDV